MVSFYIGEWMEVLLIDVDSKIPNLALMQIAAFHKNQGDNVGFHISKPDIVYGSIIFSKNKHLLNGLKFFYPDAKIHIGGSGHSYKWLPSDMQKIKPDYQLYNMDYSMGFTTRGCIRNCPFCIVKAKEGKFQRWQHVEEFHDEKFNKIQLLDNNWLADKEWFFENSNWLIENEISIMEHGMDIRLLTSEICEQLARMKWIGHMHFAFDNMKDERAVINGIQLLKEAGIDTRHLVQIYVLVDFNTTLDDDVYRCELLKKHETNAFVMAYRPPDKSYPPAMKNKHVKHIQRWANRKWVFWATDYKNYKKGCR